jgi:ankyrin repeat protein
MGQTDVAKLLISHKADLNARNSDGNIPLQLAASEDQIDVVTLLLTGKVDVNSRNNSGNTALFNAKLKGHDDVVDLLREHGGH